MARVHTITNSRTVRRCHQGHDIPVGSRYTWAAPGFRASKKYACGEHPFRPSQLTTGLVSEALAAAERFEEAIDHIDHDSPDALGDLKAAVEDFASELEGYVSQREDALDAWENGNSQLEELYETAQAAYDEVEGWEPEDWDGDGDARDNEDHEDHEEAVGSWADHVSDQVESARDLAALEF